MPKCDAVFQGGGVKGTGFAGAVMILEEAGYKFENIVGTSAGAIVAALLSAGYSGAEIRDELMRVDYKKFLDASWLVRTFYTPKLVNLAFKWGIYRTDAFEAWLGGLLERKGKIKFRDIRTNLEDERYRYGFQAIASDITSKTMLLLPGDLKKFGIDPDEFPIAKAVRMSMCIPFYFEPYRLTGSDGKEHVILDGGLLSNYPVWVLDDGSHNPAVPTFGFKFGSHNQNPRKKDHGNTLIGFTKSIVSTLLSAWDNRHISESSGDLARTILISTAITSQGKQKVVGTTEFDISDDEKRQLLENGMTAARKFLAGWNFEKWKKEFRANTVEQL
ncbi:MAG: patatin-like phospholipase family protein [Defluviitaleaceae bacterium]|nr:patatin-like phospholipase family protein [Defluviitaleaceae bacterium]